MKLILNNKSNEAIKCDTFNRSLDIPDSNILFNIYFSSNNLADALSMTYLVQYANEPITNYKLLDEEDEVVTDSGIIEAQLTSFSENFSNNYYNASANIQVKE